MGNYYLIGEHLGHSFSPELHRRLGRYDYECVELSPAELGRFLRRRAFSGLNVTIPFKAAVIPYLDHLDEAAAAIGAVNTVVNRGGALWGYNTDFGGLAAALSRTLPGRAGNPLPASAGALPPSASDGALPPVLSGKTVLILGTGGTSKTALAVCRALGAARAYRVSRTAREGALTYDQARTEARHAQVLINTTPVGMFPDPDGLPLDLSAFPHLEAVIDCVYNPLRTRLVLAAEARGIPASGGLFMLVQQAALSCELFTGVPVAEEEVNIIYRDLLKARQNLVLIGMPGSGKTTVGRLLAQKTGKEFVDLDEEVTRRAGKSIPVIFAEEGEPVFRAIEAAVIQDVSGAGGRVIATGGGAVLRPENVIRLKQNGCLFFLDRPPAALEPSPDRPLADTAEKLAALQKQRHPIYLAAADRVIPAGEDPSSTEQAVVAAPGIRD